MIMPALHSGYYLVGREDGTVDPVLVRLSRTNQHGGYIDGHPHSAKIAIHALKQNGWWWRRIVVPKRLPSDLDSYPHVTGTPDDV